MKKIKIKLSQEARVCECGPRCYKRATEHHHEFPNTKRNRALYGNLIDHDLNVKFVSHDCHPKMKNISEREFCERLGIEPRSKTEKFKGWDFGRC